MIVYTDSSSAPIIGAQNATAIIPTSCNSKPSVIGFEPGGGSELSAHIVTQQTVAMFGVLCGIPDTVKVDDCMCGFTTPCGGNTASVCTIGGAGTPIGTVTCGATGTTIDVGARFLEAFGPH